MSKGSNRRPENKSKYDRGHQRIWGVRYICEDCGCRFKEDDAAWHFGNPKTFQADMAACPKCDSEELIEA